MTLTKENVEEALQGWVDPYLGCDVVSARMVRSIRIEGTRIEVHIALGYPPGDFRDVIDNALKERLKAAFPDASLSVTLEVQIASHAVQKNLKPLEGVRNIVAVASGKGGVGKSTTAINLASALSRDGARVGLLDADIYGPSVPHMLGLSGKPDVKDGNRILPKEAFGLQVMSIGFLVDEDQPMIWRGPMVTGALQQLLQQTLWKDLDYLIVDLPPGTGDIQLSLSQQIPVSGAVIVTTPQDIALLDAQKGLRMFQQVQVPVLGLVENMSMHVCSNCGHAEPIFGEGGGTRMAEKYGTELLGQLPLDRSIREHADQGYPIVLDAKQAKFLSLYQEIGRRLTARLALKGRDYSHRFPKITVSND